MKKLIVVLAIAAMASIVNAASVSWKVTGPTDINGDPLAKGCVAYLFIGDTISADVISAVNNHAYTGDGSFSNTTVNSMGNISKTVSGFDATTAYTLSMLLIDTDNISTATYYKIAEGLQVTTTGTALAASAAFTEQISAATWQSIGGAAVPEPTSALMLLVGLAGLALKRKVA